LQNKKENKKTKDKNKIQKQNNFQEKLIDSYNKEKKRKGKIT